jgi:hypothetical protein
MPPVRLMLFGIGLSIDLNFVAVIAAALSIGAVLSVY